MSVPRTLTLRKQPSGDNATYTLIQRPVQEFRKLSNGVIPLNTTAAAWPPVAVSKPAELTDMNFILETTLQPGSARSCGIRIRTGEDEYTEVGYDREPGVVYVDRRKSGNVDFHPAFAGRHDAPVQLIDGAAKLSIIVDRSTIEVFINDGEAVISDRIFPTSQTAVIEAFAGDISAKLRNTTLQQLKSIWKN
jgi:fructan beta-fructosidase